jgi:hypothetical protein
MLLSIINQAVLYFENFEFSSFSVLGKTGGFDYHRAIMDEFGDGKEPILINAITIFNCT